MKEILLKISQCIILFSFIIGSSQSPILIKDFNSFGDGIDFYDSNNDTEDVIIYEDKLIFSALVSDGSSNNYGLWEYDGTEVSLLGSFNGGHATDFIEYKGKLYFLSNGDYLWEYDGENVTLIQNMNTNSSLFIEYMTVYQDNLFFSANDGDGFKVFKFDGTSIDQVSNFSYLSEYTANELIVCNDTLYTVDYDGTGTKIWKLNNGVFIPASDYVSTQNGATFLYNLRLLDDRIIFSGEALDGVYTLWEFNGEDISNLYLPISTSSDIYIHNDEAFYFFTNGSYTYQMRYNGEEADTIGYRVLQNDQISYNGINFLSFYKSENDNSLYFSTEDKKLFQYKEGQFNLIKTFQGYAYPVKTYRDGLIYRLHSERKLFVFNGVVHNEISLYNSNINYTGYPPNLMKEYKDQLIFQFNDGETGNELWKLSDIGGGITLNTQNTLNFDTIKAGNAVIDSILIENTGSETITVFGYIDSLSAFSTNGDTIEIASGESSYLKILFSSNSEGNYEDEVILSIKEDLFFSYKVPLKGNSTYDSSLEFDIDTLFFEYDTLLGSVIYDSIRVENTGTDTSFNDLSLLSSSYFNLNEDRLILPPNSVRYISISFDPSHNLSSLLYESKLSIVQEYDTNNYEFTIQGKILKPEMSFDDSELDFGFFSNWDFYEIGSAETKYKKVTISNIGDGILYVTDIDVIDSLRVHVSESNFSVEPKSSKEITVSLTLNDFLSHDYSSKIIFTDGQNEKSNLLIDAKIKRIDHSPDIDTIDFGNILIGSTAIKKIKLFSTPFNNCCDGDLYYNYGFRSTDDLIYLNDTSSMSIPYDVNLFCKPTSEGNIEGTISFYYFFEAIDYEYKIPFKANVVPANKATFSINPDTIQFGTINSYDRYEKTFIIKNTGEHSIDIYDVVSTNKFVDIYCDSTTILPAQQKEVKVSFTAYNNGEQSGYIIFDANLGGISSFYQAEVIQPENRISVNPTSFSFGDTHIYDEAYDTIVVSNIGLGDLFIYDIYSHTEFGSDQDTSVSILDEYENDLFPSFQLSSGEERKIPIRFKPAKEGVINGNITVYSNDINNPFLVIPYTATGVIDESKLDTITTLTTLIDFGNVKINEIKQSDIILDNRTSILDSYLYKFTSTEDLIDFTFDSYDYIILQPGEFRKVKVSFKASQIGNYNGFIDFEDYYTYREFRIPFKVNVIDSNTKFVITPSIFKYSILEGTTVMDSILIENTGDEAVTIHDTYEEDFYSISTIEDVSNLTLQPNEKKYIHVTFTPSSEDFEDVSYFYISSDNPADNLIVVPAYITTIPNPITNTTGGLNMSEYINLYPNPIQDGILKVEVKNSQNMTVSLNTMDGLILISKVFNGNSISEIDLSSYPNGAYYLKLETNSGQTGFKKIILSK